MSPTDDEESTPKGMPINRRDAGKLTAAASIIASTGAPGKIAEQTIAATSVSMASPIARPLPRAVANALHTLADFGNCVSHINLVDKEPFIEFLNNARQNPSAGANAKELLEETARKSLVRGYTAVDSYASALEIWQKLGDHALQTVQWIERQIGRLQLDGIPSEWSATQEALRQWLSDSKLTDDQRAEQLEGQHNSINDALKIVSERPEQWPGNLSGKEKLALVRKLSEFSPCNDEEKWTVFYAPYEVRNFLKDNFPNNPPSYVEALNRVHNAAQGIYCASLDKLGKDMQVINIGYDTNGIMPLKFYSEESDIDINSDPAKVRALFDQAVSELPERLYNFFNAYKQFYKDVPAYKDIIEALPDFIENRLPQLVKEVKASVGKKSHAERLKESRDIEWPGKGDYRRGNDIY